MNSLPFSKFNSTNVRGSGFYEKQILVGWFEGFSGDFEEISHFLSRKINAKSENNPRVPEEDGELVETSLA